MKKDPKIFLEHIIESIGEIERNIEDMSKDQFLTSVTIQDAVVRRLEVIGEATKNLPSSFKNKHPEASWKKISGLRDVLIHQYFGVNLDLVWKIIKKDILKLKKQASKLLEKL